MNPKRIEVGDWVDISFPNAVTTLRGVVDKIPYATGDSWVILEYDGPVPTTVHYVQQFEDMVLREKKAK